MFCVVEGQDATGKDTQAKLLAEYFKKQGKNVIHYAESGTASEDPFIAGIASLNYGHDYHIDKRTRVLLYLINRYEQWAKLAEPALKANDEKNVVIITRNWFSTLIYEGYGTGVSKSLIARLHKEMLPERYFKPDHIVFLTLDTEERIRRIEAQNKRSTEFFKSQGFAFQEKLNNAYLSVAKDYKVPTMDASGTPEEVHERLKAFWKI